MFLLYNIIMDYEKYMKICTQLARMGEGKTSPNPLVGCVILDKDGNQISTGFHAQYGKNHAERDALLKLNSGEEKGGTLIVNLEPCSHHGKTPPCTDLIIERGIKKVVIGMRDVNPIVCGNGIRKLQEAGIEVVEGVLEDECKKLNEVFIKNMTENKPYIAIKTATTLDGKIATSNGSSKWITSEVARNEVKKIRNRYDAILTTSSTILADNPSMEHKKKLILDRKLRTNLESKIYQQGEIYLFNESLDMFEGGINFIKTPTNNEKLDLEFIFNKAWELGIKSILIEAGGHLNGEALKFADKIYHFIAPKITGDNSSLSCFDYRKISDINESESFEIKSVEKFGRDLMLIYSKQI
jgi:diaminohydroxyphosphoribosylaminopyrimidine deaminase/5-amino-6-(5-phosphoribosylamino)uracil reductase